MSQDLRVALVWNGTVVEEMTFDKISSNRVLVGDARENDFFVPAEGLPSSFEMFKRVGDGYVFRFTDALQGKVRYNDEEYDVSDFTSAKGVSAAGSESSVGKGSVKVYEAAINPGDWGVIDLDHVSIFFQFVDSNIAPLYRPPFHSDMIGLTTTIILAALAHGAFLLMCELNYNPQLKRAEFQLPNRFVQFLADPPADMEEEQPEELDEPEEDTTGKKAGGEEGKFGDPDTDIPESKIPKTDGEMVDKIDVKNLGVNKALGSNLLGAGPLKNLFGQSDGFDAKMNVAMSGEGNSLVVGRGAGGMGMRGTGRGGGGDGVGRIHGMGKVDTGGGRGVNAKLGKKGTKKVKPKVRRGAGRVGQFCEKANIRQVVGRGTGRIRYCYEKALQTNPTLAGKVTINWTVGLSGSVMKAVISNSTLGNPAAEGCMVRAVQSWRFAPPKGGHCVIAYPFSFSGPQ